MTDMRAVFFFDIDNCLYSRHTRIADLMSSLIHSYFQHHLSLPPAAALSLHKSYYRDYGLALTGLVAHHQIDPMQYNREVDDALPLDRVLNPDPALRAFLLSFDRTKVKLWLLTNAYVTHARRVVRLLGVEDCFEGLTYCDYAQLGQGGRLIAKPGGLMWEKAERESEAVLGDEAGHGGCWFVDDSGLNCLAAKRRGWEVVRKLENGDRAARAKARDQGGGTAEDSVEDEIEKEGIVEIEEMGELKVLFPHFFKTDG